MGYGVTRQKKQLPGTWKPHHHTKELLLLLDHKEAIDVLLSHHTITQQETFNYW